jgi:hypothetical protein
VEARWVVWFWLAAALWSAWPLRSEGVAAWSDCERAASESGLLALRSERAALWSEGRVDWSAGCADCDGWLALWPDWALDGGCAEGELLPAWATA